jgi:hypothetical protein
MGTCSHKVPEKSSIMICIGIASVGTQILVAYVRYLVWSGIDTRVETRAIEYADDRYIKGKLSVSLQVLSEVKSVLKEDTGTPR